MLKSKVEIANIRKACVITDTIFRKVVGDFHFKTERELCRCITGEIHRRGLPVAFRPIVATGVGAAEPHHKAGDTMLRGFTVIDFGVRVGGYCSDMTRTVYVGVPSPRERALYERVRAAKGCAESVVRPGVRCSDADMLARKALGRYAKYFIHTLGHGLGKRIHEAPRIYHTRVRNYFREGMAVTIEPGIYISGKFGIRIEDTCVVTPNGMTLLTQSPLDLFVFEAR